MNPPPNCRPKPAQQTTARLLVLWLAAISLMLSACTQAAHPDQPSVESFVQRYFSTWSAKDMTGYGACFHPSARVTFVERGGLANAQGLTDFLHGQQMGHERSSVPMKEVPTEIKISGDARVAQVQVRWRLTKGNEVVTGTDYFTLVKTSDGWRIMALVFYND
jgi:ketosteroid isomerase-like protein